MHGEYSTILVQINAWILSIGIKAGALKKKTRQYTTIIPTLVHASAWVVPTLVQANAWIVPSLFQAIAWIVPNHSRRGQCLDSIDWNICRCKKKKKNGNAQRRWVLSPGQSMDSIYPRPRQCMDSTHPRLRQCMDSIHPRPGQCVDSNHPLPDRCMDSTYRRLFAIIAFRSVSAPSRRVCVMFHFRAVPLCLCFVPFPRRPAASFPCRAAASQLSKKQGFVGSSM